MAESTCVMHPFSYTSPSFSNDTQEENPIYGNGIGDSVSFGRFMSESLGWEKWSSFNNDRNRYVEEAKKYSKKGSVAQKKAYFEAHFKKMAALKAAALLEQQNSAENSCISQGKIIENDDQVNDNIILHDSQKSSRSNSKMDANNCDNGFIVHQNELYLIDRKDEVNANKVKDVNLEVEEDESLNQIEGYSDQKDEICHGSKVESSGVSHMDKPPLQAWNSGQQKTSLDEKGSNSSKIIRKNRPLSSYMSLVDDGNCRASSTTALNSIHSGKENSTSLKKKTSNSNSDHPDKTKRTPLRTSINREFNKILSPVIRKIKVSKDCSTPLRTPSKASGNGVSVPSPVSPNFAKRGESKSPNTNKIKISSPIIPTSFCLRSEQRAASRKQKLEEKFNATTTEKAPQPSKFKEKAEAELSKFRQNFCFKAMSSPDYHTENETRQNPKHKMESPKRGKNPNTSKSHSRSSLPPRLPTAKQSGSKNVQQKN